jgi:hypothetical protein
MLLTEKFKAELDSAKYAPISNNTDRGIMAQLLENQTEEVARLINEGTLSGDIASFTPILVPMIRRIYPQLIAHTLAGVQPLSMPTGYLYAMTSRYTGNSTNGISPTKTGMILTLADATGFTVGGSVSSTANAGVGTIVYVEGNNILIDVVSGTFAALNNVDNTSSFVATATSIVATYSNEAGFQKVLKNYTGPYATATAEALGTSMKEIGFDITRAMAEAQSRKLKGRYTMELFADLKKMHNIDAEQELMDLMGIELQLEMDREIIAAVNNVATVTPDAVINSYQGRWEIEKYRSLGIKISNESRTIGQLTRRGAGNVLTVSPKVAVMLEQVGTFITASTASTVNASTSGMSPANVGTFDGKYKVVVDNFAASDYVTVSYKGAGNKDAGVFFAPYVGASFTKTVDVESGQPNLILSSRYAIVNNPLNPETYVRTFAVNLGSTVLA